MDIQPNPANRKVAYFYNPLIGRFVYAKDHPMKPERISMAHNLIVNYDFYRYISQNSEKWMFITPEKHLKKRCHVFTMNSTLIIWRTSSVKTLSASFLRWVLTGLHSPQTQLKSYPTYQLDRNSKLGSLQTVLHSTGYTIIVKFHQERRSIVPRFY